MPDPTSPPAPAPVHRLGHGRAVALMVLVTLLWSIAGVVTRQLEAARSFEVTFWRSAFNALSLVLLLRALRGPALWAGLVRARWPVWVSGLCWSVMFTAFMFAITMTSVARVLVTLAAAPLVTALMARVCLGHAIAPRTWLAIVVAGGGIGWMFGAAALQGNASDIGGMLVALAVPMAAAVNWTLLQHIGRRAQRPPHATVVLGEGTVRGDDEGRDDMLPAVLIGAALSALAMLPFSWPFAATPTDLGWLAMLGAVQLAIPCLLVVRVARELPAPELALLGLLEVVFGVAWAWLGAGERPANTTLSGGALVLGALLVNEWLGWRATGGRPATTP